MIDMAVTKIQRRANHVIGTMHDISALMNRRGLSNDEALSILATLQHKILHGALRAFNMEDD